MSDQPGNKSQKSPGDTASPWQRADALSFVRISGEDAGQFLQAQLTCDIRSLTKGTALPFAWCSPAGRVRHSGWLANQGEHFFLLLAANRADDFIAALKPYVLRAKMSLEPARDTGLVLSWRPLADPATGVCRGTDNRQVAQFVLPGLPARDIRISQSGVSTAATHDNFILAGIRAGLFELPAILESRYLPQMLNLDLTDGVSFTKGCYPGQEVIARTQNLGTVKRRMLRFSVDSGDWQPGTDVLSVDKPVGKIVACGRDAEACEVLAVVSLDAAATGSLTLNAPTQAALHPEPLPYEIPELVVR